MNGLNTIHGQNNPIYTNNPNKPPNNLYGLTSMVKKARTSFEQVLNGRISLERTASTGTSAHANPTERALPALPSNYGDASDARRLIQLRGALPSQTSAIQTGTAPAMRIVAQGSAHQHYQSMPSARWTRITHINEPRRTDIVLGNNRTPVRGVTQATREHFREQTRPTVQALPSQWSNWTAMTHNI